MNAARMIQARRGCATNPWSHGGVSKHATVTKITAPTSAQYRSIVDGRMTAMVGAAAAVGGVALYKFFAVKRAVANGDWVSGKWTSSTHFGPAWWGH
jgi:hypothetical protein